MTDLITRLESATEGSRQLDDEIAVFVGALDVVNLEDVGEDEPVEVWQSRHYTTSIDAALTLVPKGWGWCLYYDGSVEMGLEPSGGQMMDATVSLDAYTPALALTIAALKAREL